MRFERRVMQVCIFRKKNCILTIQGLVVAGWLKYFFFFILLFLISFPIFYFLEMNL
jgi:hypothetical protein